MSRVASARSFLCHCIQQQQHQQRRHRCLVCLCVYSIANALATCYISIAYIHTHICTYRACIGNDVETTERERGYVVSLIRFAAAACWHCMHFVDVWNFEYALVVVLRCNDAVYFCTRDVERIAVVVVVVVVVCMIKNQRQTCAPPLQQQHNQHARTLTQSVSNTHTYVLYAGLGCCRTSTRARTCCDTNAAREALCVYICICNTCAL